MNTLVLIDDHTMIRRGLSAYFTQTGRWQVLGEAESLEEAAALFTELKKTGKLPNVVLLDIELKGAWGLDLIPGLREWYGKKKPPVLVYSVYDDYAHLKAVIRSGAAGYVCKSQGEAELEAAMDEVLQGRRAFAPELLPHVAEVSDITLNLTKRQRQIFDLVQRSRSNLQIAAELGLKLRTVENYLSAIYEITGAKSRKKLKKL
ncbi:DNA-binding response regulator [Spirochaetia bacterium]|nr:DNA-binding response regulator [Spirochaetia bacterium]